MTFSSSRTLPGQSYDDERVNDRRRNRVDALAQDPAVPIDEVPDEQRDVFTPVAERRHRDRKDVEPVEQVAAEPALPGFLEQIAIGRGDDADVDVDRPRTAEALDLAVLQHAQELRLELERQLADLVEEERAAIGQLEAAGLRRVRAGEGAALVAEQLALDQRRRQRGAVDDDERPVAPAALAVERAREQLLARARLAEEQDGRVGRRATCSTRDST